MYSHILVTVAYDAGHDATPSLSVARSLLSPGGKITLMHVMEPAPLFALNYMPQGWDKELRGAIEADLAQLALSFERVTTVVEEGDAAQEITEYARSNGVDCIVIASHRPGTAGLMIGSTASKVVSRAQCAIHVVRRASVE